MSPRAEFFMALMADQPALVVSTLLSLLLCASVFVGSVFLKNRSQQAYAAALPLEDDLAAEPKGDFA